MHTGDAGSRRRALAATPGRTWREHLGAEPVVTEEDVADPGYQNLVA